MNGLGPGDLPGAVGAPGTTVLIGGGQTINYGPASGARFTFGGWLDSCGTVGVEGSGFWLGRVSSQSSVSANSAGSPLISVPFFDVTTSMESAYFISLPGFVTGSVVVNSTSELWGAEISGVYNLYRSDTMVADALVGFRYADLLEKLSIDTASTAVGPGVADIFFAGGFVGFPTTVATTDSFQTRNQFYGGQIGARASACYDRFSLDLTGKVALGANEQTINISGSTSTYLPGTSGPTPGAPPFFGPPGPPAFATAPGGLLALPSNSGHFTETKFSVIPEIELRLKARVWRNLSAFVGYDFMYWSEVVRPGDQIQHAINPLQSPSNPNLVYAPGTPPALPTVPFHESSFWAQGLTFGVEFKY
jgi:hypothetical protein